MRNPRSRGTPLIDLQDKIFGKWVVVERAHTENDRIKWLCLCECGASKFVYGHSLRNGRSTSCGACHKESAGAGYRWIEKNQQTDRHIATAERGRAWKRY